MKNLIILFFVLIFSTQNLFSQESWTSTSTGTNVPSPRFNHVALWTGVPLNQMIIWGGNSGTTALNTGSKFDPNSNTWTAMTTTGAPAGREQCATVWTGSTLIVWGGNLYPSTFYNDGAIYNPATNTWTSLPPSPLSVRTNASAIWTGSVMVIWGGQNSTTQLGDGAIYNPILNTWTMLSNLNAPPARYSHTAIWTGSKMIIWGGVGAGGAGTHLQSGGILNMLTTPPTWEAATTITANTPSPRADHTAIWTGTKMIIWGGFGPINNVGTFLNTGGIFDPSTNNWETPPALFQGRSSHAAVWTGKRMVIFGGYGNSGPLNKGGVYDINTNFWTSMNETLSGYPGNRYHNSIIWTGTQIIVWGGCTSLTSGFDTGGIYSNPTLDIKNTSSVSTSYNLSQNYPNPFNPVTNIQFAISKKDFVKITVYDITGKEVKTLVNNVMNTGKYNVDFDASGLESGIYFYRLFTSELTETKKMMLLK